MILTPEQINELLVANWGEVGVNGSDFSRVIESHEELRADLRLAVRSAYLNCAADACVYCLSDWPIQYHGSKFRHLAPYDSKQHQTCRAQYERLRIAEIDMAMAETDEDARRAEG